MALIGSMFCASPAFSRAFFLSSSNMTTGCEGHLTPFGVPLGVRNRKLRNTCSDRRSRDPLEVSLGCFLRRPPTNIQFCNFYANSVIMFSLWFLQLRLFLYNFLKGEKMGGSMPQASHNCLSYTSHNITSDTALIT